MLWGKAVRIDATSANPRGTADERAVLQHKIEADRCSILDRGYISYGLWNAINAMGSSYVCRSSDRAATRVMHVNDLTEADRAANVISDEIVEVGWKSRQRTRPDHPVRLICVEANPHESYRGMQGPHCDGVAVASSALRGSLLRGRWSMRRARLRAGGEGLPLPLRRRLRPAQPGWRSAGRSERTEPTDGRSERPARWYGATPSRRASLEAVTG